MLTLRGSINKPRHAAYNNSYNIYYIITHCGNDWLYTAVGCV